MCECGLKFFFQSHTHRRCINVHPSLLPKHAGGMDLQVHAAVLAAGESETILDKTIKVRFDANTERGFAWDFKPEVREMELRIGETGLVFYEAHNPTDRPVAGQASYNVAPFSAGGYFTKIACFCFELQVLQPGETLMMPVTFYVDPEIVDDIEAKYVRTITLSYTFHPADLPEAETEEDVTDASAVLPRAQDVN